MKKITVYTMDHCSYCERAKALLTQRGVAYTEVRVSYEDDKAWADLEKRTGLRTMPQIFADDEVIGGYTDLVEYVKRELV